MKLFYYIIHDSDVISLQSEINILSSPSPAWFVSTHKEQQKMNHGDCMTDEFFPSLFVFRETNGSLSKEN